MADELSPENPAASPAAAPAKPSRPARAASAPKKAKAASKSPAKRALAASAKAARATPSAGAPSRAIVLGVYVVLGILVILTSYFTGYLVGKGGAGSGNGGPGGADVVEVIEYSDFQCPFCARAVGTIDELKQQYGSKIKVTYKHFPLESIHPNAFNAAVAAECVRETAGEEAFWTYHDALFANQNALDTASLKKTASAQGVDIASCLDGQETAATVRAHMDEARARGVSGTPSFWVGDELVVGAVPTAQLAAVVDRKLSGAPAPAAPTPAEAQAPPAKVDMDAGSYILGDADAPVLLVEFTDYQCPFCKRAHDETFAQIKEAYIDTGKVRYSVRHFPLPFHADAQKAGEAVECAGKLGGSEAFFAYHDALFANQASLGVASLKTYAAELNLNAAAFASCLDSGEFASKVQDDLNVGSDAGVGGTPSFFVNGNIVVGAQPFSAFKTAIDAELS